MAASLVLLREGAGGLEVFMVERRKGLVFSSALVFPGGKLSQDDTDPAVHVLCDGAAGLATEALALRVAALRETFEESGLLLARPEGDASLLSPAGATALVDERAQLASGALPLRDFLNRHKLRLACDALTAFAHWVTPEWLARRFDTHFYVAVGPDGHDGRHDGGELISSQWLRPIEALSLAEKGERKLMFPTRMNLLRLSESAAPELAIEAARARGVVRVEPRIEIRAGQRYVTIPCEAGYPISEQLFESIDD